MPILNFQSKKKPRIAKKRKKIRLKMVRKRRKMEL